MHVYMNTHKIKNKYMCPGSIMDDMQIQLIFIFNFVCMHVIIHICVYLWLWVHTYLSACGDQRPP